MQTQERVWIFSLMVLFLLAMGVSVFAPQIRKTLPLKTEFQPSKGVGVLYVYGPLETEASGGFFDPSGTDSLIDALEDMKTNPRVKALVLRINSPGGTVGASQELFRELDRFKRETHKPIVVSIADMGTSGAYWVALSGDKILANPGSMVGNIGVIMGNYDLSDLQQKFGIGFNTIKSGPYKDVLSSWRKLTPNDKAVLQAMIQDVYEQFVNQVKVSRKLSDQRAHDLSDGRIYTGRQAKEAGLIDGFGGLNDAITLAGSLAGIKGKPDIISNDHSPAFNWRQLLRNQAVFQGQGPIRGFQ
ncbi:MAG: signal peptide peptidase SppA [Candidatus Margulisiibacteriota bacterium]